MKKALYLFILILVISFSSCSFGGYQFAFTDKTVEDRSPCIQQMEEIKPQSTGHTKYSFLIVTDMHIGAARYSHNDDGFFKWLDKQFDNPDEVMRPAFVINLGDIADTGSSKEYKEYADWETKVKMAAQTKLGIADYKIFNVAGNHDIYNDGAANYRKMVYPHSFSYCFSFSNSSTEEGFDFYFLDSANGTFGIRQLNDLEKKFKQNNRPKLIFTHYPLYLKGINMMIQDTLERAKVLTFLAEGDAKLVMGGHAHVTQSKDFGPFLSQITAAYAGRNTVCLVTVDEQTCEVSTKVVSF